MTRCELIEKLLTDLGVTPIAEAVARVDVFVADERNLEWYDSGNQTWEDRLRVAEGEAYRCRLALEVALRDLGR